MFQSIGERLNKFSSVVIRHVKKLLNCKNVQVMYMQSHRREGTYYTYISPSAFVLNFAKSPYILM